jgi:N-acetylglucosaminyl-diphospho-decaprenol L-rhamnosyltransferase
VPAPVTPVDVEISIVSLGDTHRLAACVDTLRSACEGLAWRLAIVDNSPAGQDLRTVIAAAPCASAVRSEGRRGFGTNHNLVLRDVLAEARARYVLVLNDDTELDRRAVTTLVACADADRSVAAASPQIRDANGNPEPSQLAWPSAVGEAMRTALPRRAPTPVRDGGWLNGACILLRTSALREVGLFDTAFFLFFEDADLCLRLVRAGWRVQPCTTASIVHHGHGTILTPELRPDIEEQVLRSRYLFFRKHHGPAAAWLVTLLVRAALLLRAAKMLVEASAGRGARGFSRPRTLWALACIRPARPSRLEREALQALP